MSPENKKSKKVFVGLSGGVDSSVSAALLKEEGYEVTGVFIKVWYPDFLDCDWKSEKRDAMRVSAHLDIPFKMIDLSKEYKEEVIDYMIEEYKNGRTPNPDVMCNKYVKFGAFFDWAIKNGADYVATGHYAQVRENTNSDFELVEAKDSMKDQTYFLWNLTQDNLKKTLFPIGKYNKEAVRKKAEKLNLFTKTKKDSQGLCFIGDLDMKDFLSRYIEIKNGKVLNTKGEEVGEHSGAILYTIGERHGFVLYKKSPEDKPMYVIKKDIIKNTLVVSENKPTRPVAEKIKLDRVNLINNISNNEKIEVRCRYRQTRIQANFIKENDNYSIVFDKPQEDVAFGQSVVFYRKDVCLGGGIVVE